MLNIEKLAKAIEEDAGEVLPDIRQALAEAKDGMGRVTTPELLLEEPFLQHADTLVQQSLSSCHRFSSCYSERGRAELLTG
jgi:hypothetical protein